MRVLRLRNDNADVWVEKNPVLEQAEPAYERDTGRFKIGNGLDHWIDLPYQNELGSGGDETPFDLLEHINSLTPHPVYDDGPSLSLIYQNAKV